MSPTFLRQTSQRLFFFLAAGSAGEAAGVSGSAADRFPSGAANTCRGRGHRASHIPGQDQGCLSSRAQTSSDGDTAPVTSDGDTVPVTYPDRTKAVCHPGHRPAQTGTQRQSHTRTGRAMAVIPGTETSSDGDTVPVTYPDRTKAVCHPGHRPAQTGTRRQSHTRTGPGLSVIPQLRRGHNASHIPGQDERWQ